MEEEVPSDLPSGWVIRASLVGALVLCTGWCAGCEGRLGYEYVACTTNADCVGSSSCRRIAWRDGTGSMCTATCGTADDCPHSGRCLDVNASGTYLCYEHCSVDTDCPTTFVCQALSTGGAVCLPTIAAP